MGKRLQDETGDFMHMYWLDACEENGTIYLIGKVAVPATLAGGDKPVAHGVEQAYLSACVVVHGIEREVLVLPRYNTRSVQLFFLRMSFAAELDWRLYRRSTLLNSSAYEVLFFFSCLLWVGYSPHLLRI